MLEWLINVVLWVVVVPAVVGVLVNLLMAGSDV